MTATIDILDSALYTDVGNFIVATLAVPVIQGYPNRVAMPPASPGFVEMTILRKVRLNTNIDAWDQTIPDPTTATQETHYDVVMQIDCYGANAGSWAAILSNLWRDDVACEALADTCQPLYSDDPIRAPLVNEEEMYEDKWIITAHLQYNPVVSTVQDFADTLAIDLINVFEAYPP